MDNCNLSRVDDILSELDYISPSDLESLLRRKREDMRRKEILSRYPIKQLPVPDCRYWVRIDGKQYFKKSKVTLENLILELNKKQEITLVKLFENYIAERKLQVVPTTWANDIKYFDMYLKDSKLGNKPISNLNLDDGYEFFEYVQGKKEGELKEKYWHNVKSFLNTMMKYCIRHGYSNSNPFEYLIIHSAKFSPKTDLPTEDTVFSKEEEKSVCMLAIRDAESTCTGIPLAIPFLFHTGLRDGELITLKWCDVVYIQGKAHLYVRRIQVGNVNDDGYVRGRQTANRCKTKKSIRKIPLNSYCVELLERIKHYNEYNGFPIGDENYIFYRNYRGKVETCTERSFAGRLEKYCNQAHMISKSPHDVRRTALTNLWIKGVPIKVIQMIAGHTTQKQTEEYLRITEKTILEYDYTELLVDDTEPAKRENKVQNKGHDNIVMFRKRG